jgi:hypothetical protein
MQWQGVKPSDMTQEQLDAAREYTESAIEECASQYTLLMLGYEELAAEYRRRAEIPADRTLN